MNREFLALAQDRLRDLQMEARAEGVRLGELRKINKDFANAYRFRRMTVYYKEPLKLRLESEVQGQRITYILDGGRKLVIAPRQRVFEDVTNAPGKRQTSLDFGFITPALARLLEAKWLRDERENGVLLKVFELTWGYTQDTARHIVWIDPERRYMVRREWYSFGVYRARFEYKDPVQAASGIWIPSKVEVYNVDQRFGGRTVNSNIRVNQGLDDELFRV